MLDPLRKLITRKFGRQISAARDCNDLAEAIKSNTNRNISSTTLRRYFGLLPSKTAFSKYNLDTLSIYAGYDDFNSYTLEYGANKININLPNESILEEIKQITRYTLNSIFRKALTDFNKTIPRQELNKRVDKFLESDYMIFPLIAPGGYGKSTALAHWVKSNLENHLVLFSPASIFHSLINPGKDLNRKLSMNLKSADNVYNTLIPWLRDNEKKLIIVIDALDEISSEPEKLIELAEYILDNASLYAHTRSIKVIFSSREAVWHTHLAEIFNLRSEREWFEEIDPGLETGYTNLPLLSNSEIRLIISGYSKAGNKRLVFDSIPWDIRELLRIPIHLHFLNELHKTGKTVERISQLDITREFIREYVFRGRYAEQKEDIIWTIIELLDSAGDIGFLNKNDLKIKLPIHLKRESAYFQGYKDLLHAGILSEEREENRFGIYQTRIAFKHQNIHQYLYSLFLIKENSGLNKNLLTEVCKSRHNMLWTSQIIAILYEIAYDGEDYDAIADFCDLPEEIIRSFNVRIAVGKSFRRKNDITKKLISRYAELSKGRKMFFEEFVDTNYIFNNFRFRIEEYLKYEKNIEPQLFGNCILFLGSFLELNTRDCHGYYRKINNIQPDSSVYPWPIGRKVTSHILYEYFINNHTIPDLEKFIGNYSQIAYSYPGYLERGLIEFELSVMTALMLIKEYTVLENMLEKSFKTYKVLTTSPNEPYIIRQNQNAVPGYFLEYARFKLGKHKADEFIPVWMKAIENYQTTFDDFQYLILLNWFVCEALCFYGDSDKALFWYNSALELSRFAEYEFFLAFLLLNDPLGREVYKTEALQLLQKTPILPERLILKFGPSVLQ